MQLIILEIYYLWKIVVHERTPLFMFLLFSKRSKSIASMNKRCKICYKVYIEIIESL